ncbi:hypothetical protein BKA56DRAFT_312223 [Ilyonectria sp. MPI-CAGE-AT-0026]|nr:hypothetical protein BKA56DRAFT_312223 [Ilyonectria sp. MPI-CAGE-AT-0026]
MISCTRGDAQGRKPSVAFAKSPGLGSTSANTFSSSPACGEMWLLPDNLSPHTHEHTPGIGGGEGALYPSMYKIF